MSTLAIKVSSCTCPNCGATADDFHPHDKDKPLLERRVTVRGFKVGDDKGYWWSQCLVCAGYYDPVTLEETPANFDRAKGWF